jgi:hypothetical protein
MDTTVIFASEVPAATISDRVRRGQLVRLATGVYTTDVTSDRAVVVRREWYVIVGKLFPCAVITDRSAITGGPVEGRLYLSHDGRNREVPLPGLMMLARAGAGPLDDDIALPGGLYQASKGRALAENTRPSRSRSGHIRRTLDEADLLTQVTGMLPARPSAQGLQVVGQARDRFPARPRSKAEAQRHGRELAELTRRELDLGSDALGDIAGLIEQHFAVDVALSPLGTDVDGLCVHGGAAALILANTDSSDGRVPRCGSSPSTLASSRRLATTSLTSIIPT